MYYYGLYCRAPWEEECENDEELFDAEESYKEDLAMEEYYEEKYGKH